MYLHQLLQCLTLSDEELQTRLLEEVDIAFDELSNQNHYKKEEDPKFFKSEKTGVLLLNICFQLLFIVQIPTRSRSTHRGLAQHGQAHYVFLQIGECLLRSLGLTNQSRRLHTA